MHLWEHQAGSALFQGIQASLKAVVYAQTLVGKVHPALLRGVQIAAPASAIWHVTSKGFKSLHKIEFVGCRDQCGAAIHVREDGLFGFFHTGIRAN